MRDDSGNSWGLPEWLGTGSTTTYATHSALKKAGYAAVRHSSGKMILTKSGSYLVGTIGPKATAVAVLPYAALGLAAVYLGVRAYQYLNE